MYIYIDNIYIDIYIYILEHQVLVHMQLGIPYENKLYCIKSYNKV